METIDLVATATQILELLSDQGISGKSLHAYTHTGIGCVIRHFQAKGILCAAPEMLDAFLLEQREFFDQGAFSVWKWRLLRRGCELLKHCAEKGLSGSAAVVPLDACIAATTTKHLEGHTNSRAACGFG